MDELKATIEQQLPGVSLAVEGAALVVAAKDVTAVCRYFKDSERFHTDYLANLTAVDYPPAPASTTGVRPGDSEGRAGGPGPDRIDVVYHLYSMEKRHGPIVLQVMLPRQHPVIASVTPIWRGAEFQEREVYDLYGVTFEGHPDLRRILMWDGFEGHPMRKDYVPEDQNVLEDR